MADLDESADGSSITLAVGESRTLALGERPTTGFRWHVVSADPAVLAVVTTSFRLRSSKPGGGGERVFHVKALNVGSSTVTCSHQRGAGAEAVVDRSIHFVFDVTG